MNPQNKWLQWTGFVVHALMAALFILAGVSKVLGLMPADKVAELGLGDKIVLIGLGEIVAALLLVIPWTSPLGTLVTSGLWGGIICFNMTHGNDYISFSAMLALTWLAAYIRGSVPLLALSPTSFAKPGASR